MLGDMIISTKILFKFGRQHYRLASADGILLDISMQTYFELVGFQYVPLGESREI